MAEYEMIAFRDDKAEAVESHWFGYRPSDEWILKVADSAGLGAYTGPATNIANFENGYIEIRKHSASTNHPPAKKRTK